MSKKTMIIRKSAFNDYVIIKKIDILPIAMLESRAFDSS